MRKQLRRVWWMTAYLPVDKVLGTVVNKLG